MRTRNPTHTHALAHAQARTPSRRAPAWLAALSFVLATGLTACGGGGDNRPPASSAGAPTVSDAGADVTLMVTPAAATDATVATSYTSSLAATPDTKADALEPVVLPDALATDDSAEPAA